MDPVILRLLLSSTRGHASCKQLGARDAQNTCLPASTKCTAPSLVQSTHTSACGMLGGFMEF
eukprot:2812950-Amphidinium_carterae.1